MEAEGDGNEKLLDHSWSYGEIATIRAQERLVIPVSIRRQVSLSANHENSTAIVELVAPGHIRLHSSLALTGKINALRADLASKAQYDPVARMHLGALGDKYREISLYDGGSRFQLSPELATYLGVTPSPDTELYIQGVCGAVDVMTMEKRNEYLANSQAEITL